MSSRKIIAILAILLLNTALLFLLLSNSGQVELNKSMELPFDTQDSDQYIAVYLGFVGCPSVCPTALSKLSAFQDEIDDSNFQFIFLNLINGIEENTVQEYAQSFHPQFKGIQLPAPQKQKFIENLHAFYAEAQESVGRKTAHSDYVYFFKRSSKAPSKWVLKYILPPVNIDLLLKTYQNTKTND